MTGAATRIIVVGGALLLVGCVPPVQDAVGLGDRVPGIVPEGSPSPSPVVGPSPSEVPVALIVRIETAVADVPAGVVRVSGTASVGARVTVNGTPVAVGADGRWSVDVPVDAPVTVVRAEASDGTSRATATVSVAVS